MRALVASLVLLGLQPQRSPSSGQVSAVLREARDALQGDSVVRVRARWVARLRRNPGDRPARLGTAQLDYLLGDFTPAISGARMVAERHADPLAAQGWLIVALSQGALARVALADAAFDRAIATARATSDSSVLASALALRALSQVGVAGGHRSDSLLREARPWIPPGDSLVLAGHLCAGAAVRVARGLGRARPDADSGMALAARHGDQRLAARCQLLVVQDQLRAGRLDSATRAVDAVASAQRAVHDRAGLTITLQLAGTLANLRGEYTAAARAFAEAAEVGGSVDNAAALAATALSAIALQHGRVDDARHHATRALRLFRAQGAQGLVVATLGQLGNIARASGDARSARRYYEQVLTPTIAARNPAALLAVRTSLVDVALMERDWPRAATELSSLRREVPDTPDVREVVGTLELLVNLRRGRLDQAERALNTLGPAPQPARAWLVGALAAELHARRGRLDSAASRLARTLDDVEQWRASLNDRQLRQALLEPRILYADPDLGVATTIARLAAGGRVREALTLVERHRARELLDQLDRSAALGDRPRPPSAAPGMRRRDQARHLTQPAVGDEGPWLPDSTTALVEFVTGAGGEPSTVLVVTGEGVRSHAAAPLDSLAPMIALFTRLATAGAASPALGKALGAQLLGAVLGHLPRRVTRLVLVPGHGLHTVPFDALVLGNGQLLGERFELSMVPSMTVARVLGARPPRGPGIVMSLGDPASPAAEALRRHPSVPSAWVDGLPQLPYAAREARDVASLFEGSVLLTGADAGEAALRTRALGAVSTLHLATHAWVDEVNLGGAILALAPSGAYDGLVLADDLAALGLDADLVTLSACATARGVDVQAEGLVGLTAPLLEAGARAVLATSWRVRDADAARFMADFYRELARGRAVGEALQRTRATARRRGAAISEWGAFVLVGDATVRPHLQPVR